MEEKEKLISIKSIVPGDYQLHVRKFYSILEKIIQLNSL